MFSYQDLWCGLPVKLYNVHVYTIATLVLPTHYAHEFTHVITKINIYQKQTFSLALNIYICIYRVHVCMHV